MGACLYSAWHNPHSALTHLCMGMQRAGGYCNRRVPRASGAMDSLYDCLHSPANLLQDSLLLLRAIRTHKYSEQPKGQALLLTNLQQMERQGEIWHRRCSKQAGGGYKSGLGTGKQPYPRSCGNICPACSRLHLPSLYLTQPALGPCWAYDSRNHCFPTLLPQVKEPLHSNPNQRRRDTAAYTGASAKQGCSANHNWHRARYGNLEHPAQRP